MLDDLVGELDRLVGDERWTAQRVRAGDYEVRTERGQVGRGRDLGDALRALIDVFDTRQAMRCRR
jgi:hypothetical protein